MKLDNNNIHYVTEFFSYELEEKLRRNFVFVEILFILLLLCYYNYIIGSHIYNVRRAI